MKTKKKTELDEIKEIHNNFVKESKILLNRDGFLQNVAFVYRKDRKHLIIPLLFSSRDEKEEFLTFFLRLLASQEIYGYTTIMDTKMTQMNIKTKQMEAKDAIVASFFSPQEKISEIFPYNGSQYNINFEKTLKIVDKRKKKVKGAKYSNDRWDLWDIREFKFTEKDNELYQKFKDENPELYKNVN